MKLFLTIIALFLYLSGFSQVWMDSAKYYLNNGFNEKSIDLIDANLENHLSGVQVTECYQLLADNYLQLGATEKFKKYALRSFNMRATENKLNYALYHSNLGEYYHYNLSFDSSVVHAKKSLDLLESDIENADSSLIARIYKVYGNCMRVAENRIEGMNTYVKGGSLFLIRKTSLKYFEKAMKFADPFQKVDILRRKGTALYDLIAIAVHPKSQNQNLKEFDLVLDSCIGTYNIAIQKAKEIMQNPGKIIARMYAMMGLTFQEIKQHHIADSLYDISLSFSIHENKITNLNEYNIAASWKGWNLEELYKHTGDIKYLYKALSVYEGAAHSWKRFYSESKDGLKGLDDAYRVSPVHKVPNICYQLFHQTNDIKYIDKALYYGDMDAYFTYRLKVKENDSVTTESLRHLIDKDEVLVIYLGAFNPNRTLVIVIDKNEVNFMSINKERSHINWETFNKVNGSKGLQKFKNSSFWLYDRIFRPVDSLLSDKNCKNLIIIPCAGYSQLNFDLLISDTLADNWHNQPYIFHKYNISYGLSQFILKQNYEPTKNANGKIGLIHGSYSNKTNLLFSERFTEWVNSNYNSVDTLPGSLQSFNEMVNHHSVMILIGHGEGSYFSDNSAIYLTDSIILSDEYLQTQEFNNELFVAMACKTNLSKSFFSEGSSGGFTKSLMYSGVRSTLTTDWEIDDKTNEFIMKKFLTNLSNGMKKSTALWMAKKAYWNSRSQDVEFNPYYWAPYRLTGNTDPIKIKKRSDYNYLYLLLFLLVPLGYLFWRKMVS
ncbi:MAG: CHAT domain-containing protein [Crocinitomicaceae bacterium]